MRTAGSYNYAWTDITYLPHKHGISWGYYVTAGGQPDCDGGTANCSSAPLTPGTPNIWNPVPAFTDVNQNRQGGNVQPTSRFLSAARDGTLPAKTTSSPASASTPEPTAAPTHAPTCAKTSRSLGNLTADFNFSQNPLPPMILPTHPPPLASTP